MGAHHLSPSNQVTTTMSSSRTPSDPIRLTSVVDAERALLLTADRLLTDELHDDLGQLGRSARQD